MPTSGFRRSPHFRRSWPNIRLRPAVAEPQRSSTRRTSSNQKPAGLITPPPAPVSGSRPAHADPIAAARQAPIERALDRRRAGVRGRQLRRRDRIVQAVLMLDDSDERAIAQLDRIHAAFDEQQALAELAAREAGGGGARPRRGRGRAAAFRRAASIRRRSIRWNAARSGLARLRRGSARRTAPGPATRSKRIDASPGNAPSGASAWSKR